MSIHDGHRSRIKKRFVDYGLDNFDEVNTLELLLFYAVPRRDTNEIAHALIERFGSLQEVFDASVEELKSVEGVGEHAAVLISLVPKLVRKAAMGKAERSGAIKSSVAAGKYFLPRFMGERDEVLYILCLDSRKRVISCVESGRGVVDSVEANIRKIVETALRYKASSVIIAHNHPGGIALPSIEDDVVTRNLYKSLKLVNIPLIDHIVVADNDFVSYSDSGKMFF